jgi:hypothetical protein
LAEKINKTMTFEDNIHQGEAETVFRSSLREKRLGRGKAPEGGAPPAFADQDQDKWLNKKFQRAQTSRKQQKEYNTRYGNLSLLLGTGN